MNEKRKKTDLLQLQRFCEMPVVPSWCSNLWFNGLVMRYPFHFLLFAQSRTGNEWRKNEAHKTIRMVINNKIESILSTAINQKDILLYEKLISVLDNCCCEENRQM